MINSTLCNDYNDNHAHCILYFAFKALQKGREVLVLDVSDNKKPKCFHFLDEKELSVEHVTFLAL